uniref:Uncharacterized protein n=1 Tax=Arundo donax TaxID=35708 RepID=A0A0A9GGC9_ARUDO
MLLVHWSLVGLICYCPYMTYLVPMLLFETRAV